MMSEVDMEYTLVGFVFPTSDGPGVCTPLYRDADENRFYVQSFKNHHRVDTLEFVGKGIGGHHHEVRSNDTCRIGLPVQHGLKLPDGSFRVFEMDALRSFFREESDLFVSHPFLFYQLAMMARDEALLMDAFGMQPVKDAIAKRIVPVVFPRTKKKAEKWSQNQERLLTFLWDFQYSSGEIASVMGFSRNAVLSKASRMGLRGADDTYIQDVIVDGKHVQLKVKRSFSVKV